MKNVIVCVLAVIALVMLIAGTAREYEMAVKMETIGYPASVEQLVDNSTYEVVAQWFDDGCYATLIRQPDGKIRYFVLNQIMLPGFYKAQAGKLVGMSGRPLTTVTSTSDPSGYGATK